MSMRKVFTKLGGAVLGTAIILSGVEVKSSITVVDNTAGSPTVLSSQSAIALREPSRVIALQSNTARMERVVHRQINQYRRKKGLAPLKLDSRISAIARQHSQKMARKRVPFGHSGSQSRYKRMFKLLSARGVAENVAYNQGHRNPGISAVAGWIKSPGHHRNLTGNYQVTGIGIARNAKGEYYFTQLFARTR